MVRGEGVLIVSEEGLAEVYREGVRVQIPIRACVAN